MGSKSAIQIACRGLGYTSDIGMEISSFVPVERGEAWELSEVYYGNTEKNRKAVKEFVNLVDSYEGVMDLAFLIEGVINARGVHASGVFITNDDFCNYSAKMLSPKGIVTSQWDLHESEYAGLVI